MSVAGRIGYSGRPQPPAGKGLSSGSPVLPSPVLLSPVLLSPVLLSPALVVGVAVSVATALVLPVSSVVSVPWSSPQAAVEESTVRQRQSWR